MCPPPVGSAGAVGPSPLPTLLPWQTPAQYSRMEKDALRVAQEMQAEFWAVSSLTGWDMAKAGEGMGWGRGDHRCGSGLFFYGAGENVRDFFFRVAALTFESSVLAELERGSARRIGDAVREYPRPPSMAIPPPTPLTLTLTPPSRRHRQHRERPVPVSTPQEAQMLPVSPTAPHISVPKSSGPSRWGHPVAMQTPPPEGTPPAFIVIKWVFLCFLRTASGCWAGGRAVRCSAWCQPSFPTHLVAVEAGLQAGGHAVGTLVALPNPPPSLAVLDADGRDACGTQ